ncbi:MAG: hypothetical protein LIP10_03600 [Clostridiales bacterium]|nr:hypothetical protein [Clostridiales bacterium]
MNKTEQRELINEIRLLGVELQNIRVLLEKNLEEPIIKPADYRKLHYYQNIKKPIFNNLDDAVQVLNNLKELLQKYGVVRMKDYYKMCGMDSDYEDTKYGWVNLDRAYIKQYRQTGYYIVLDKPYLI